MTDLEENGKKRFGSDAHGIHPRYPIFLLHACMKIVLHACKGLLVWAMFLMTGCLWFQLSGLHLASAPNHSIQSTAH